MDATPSPWSHCLDCAAISDVGMRRVNNEDSYAVALASNQANWEQKGHLFLVADGMGFHAAGELASKLAADNVPLSYQKYTGMAAPQALAKSVQDANELIRRRGDSSDEFRGMGTTCTAMVLTPQGVVAAHVGDSRCYRLRGSTFEQLTFDHSMVWDMWASGSMTPEQVQQFVPKNIITRAMGRDWNVQVDVEGPFPAQIGDVYLLCSDGLSGQIADKELGAILMCLGAQPAARLMVDLANLRGGPDNITLIVARVLGPQVPQAGAGDIQPVAKKPVAGGGAMSPIAWIFMGVFFVLGVVLALSGNLGVALASLAAGVLAAVAGLVQRSLCVKETPVAAPTGPLGRGPYIRVDAAPDKEFVDRLAATAEELNEAATQGNWAVDWTTFNGLTHRGAAAASQGDAAQAVRDYGEAISFMMLQLRQKNGHSQSS